MQKFIPIVSWLAAIFLCMSCISYAVSDIPIEAIWMVLVAIFLILLPNEIRKQF